MLQTNSYLADRYFNLLKPLNAETKLRIVTMLVNSITAERKEEATSPKSVFDLYGVWANEPEADMIEKTIREGRKDHNTRTIASFE